MFQEASCLSTSIGCFCENFSEGVNQPINSLTSLLFVVVGFYFISRILQNKSKLLPTLFAIAAFTTGFGSAYYHANFNILGQTLDVLGMFMILLAGPIALLKNRDIRFKLLLFLLLNILLGAFLIYIPELRRYVFILSVVILLIFEKNRGSNYLRNGFIIFLFGTLIWIIDNYQIYCSQSIVLNMHAWWHILTAIATLFLYKHYEYLQLR